MQAIEISNQKGFSLIEVLTALILLAIGLLGHMALQMTSLSSNQSSHFRSQAAILANNIADRIRLNPTAVEAGKYDSVDTKASPYQEPSCNSSGCGANDLAALDLYQWQQDLVAAIPSGVGTIVRAKDISDQAVFTITIRWTTEKREGLPASDSINRITMDIGV